MRFVKLFGRVGAASIALTMAIPVSAQAQKNVMFVLDASNSMWGQIDGTSKIEIAKSVLKDLAGEMPIDVRMGLVSYGHRFDRELNACDDIEQMNPIGHFSAAEADHSFSMITPKGQTPIAATLIETGNWMAELVGQANSLVLISDGLESCGGDPCAAASTLSQAGITTKIHVVGFDLSDAQRATLKCISDNGNGQMFAADDAAGMSAALRTVQADIASPEPTTEVQASEPTVEVVFEDQFEGRSLADGWSVSNADENRYIAERGELLIIGAPPAQSPLDEDMANVFSHPDALPAADWEIEVEVMLDIQHGEEVFYFGVMDDAENWLAGGINTNFDSGLVTLGAFIAKVESGAMSRFDVAVDNAYDTDYARSTERWRHHGLGEKYGSEPFYLKLSKSGRNYSLTGRHGTEGSETYKAFETESIRMVRGKKNLFLAFGLKAHGDANQGEGAAIVDYVKVRAAE